MQLSHHFSTFERNYTRHQQTARRDCFQRFSLSDVIWAIITMNSVRVLLLVLVICAAAAYVADAACEPSKTYIAEGPLPSCKVCYCDENGVERCNWKHPNVCD